MRYEDSPNIDSHNGEPLRVIRIPREPKSEGKPGNRRIKCNLFVPVVCRANDNACRHHKRRHIKETGIKALGKVQASERQRLGEPLNPTGILFCGLQGGEELDVGLRESLDYGDWCPVCRPAAESYLLRQEVR
jgi:hypothetical protein